MTGHTSVRLSLRSDGIVEDVPLPEAINAALERHRSGDLPGAARIYRAVLDAVPDQYDALNLLGALYHQANDNDKAVDFISRAVAVDPDRADGYLNLGTVLKTRQEWSAAENAFRRAIDLEPDLPGAWNNLGTIHRILGRKQEAVAAYREAVGRQPGFADAHSNLAALLLDDGDAASARESAERALSLVPSHTGAMTVLVEVFKRRGDTKQALAIQRRICELASNDADAFYNLGLLLDADGDWDDALHAHERALAANPRHGPALTAALHMRRSLCLWDGHDEHFTRLKELIEVDTPGIPPFAILAESSTNALQQRCARSWARQVERTAAAAGGVASAPSTAGAGDRITVGYLSADFYQHPTAYLAAGMFEHHDRDRFRVIAYSNGPDDGSVMRRRLIEAFDTFVDIRAMRLGEIVDRIKKDGVDILVDLKGYTQDALSEVLALRPAPIQATWLGYPGTLGAGFVDCALVDEFVVPESERRYYDETLIDLPDCYQVNDSQRKIADRTPDRVACGLPERGFVFCCFNNTWKLTREMFRVWARILDAVPGSVLWLLDVNPRSSVKDNLRREAQALGLDPGRLVFQPKLPLEEYLARYRHADLFLDTLPYNAHTTASDALWVGCPTLTCPGTTFASRVAGSLLRAVDLPELIVNDLETYETEAVALARDAARLDDLRTKLEAGRDTAPLFDTARFTRSLERVYTGLIQRARTL